MAFVQKLPLSSAEILSSLRGYLESSYVPEEYKIMKIEEDIAHKMRLYES